jgi:hypothetical protein
MVDVQIGQHSGEDRSLVGPGSERIKGDIRNIIQLTVVNDAGEIVAFDEVRRGSDAEANAVLAIDNIPFGYNYHFLLLMGHWERDYDSEEPGGDYVYKGSSPTLLAAGMKDMLVSGSGTVTIVMWPIVVDTRFTTADPDVPAAERMVSPVIGGPQTNPLLPVDWKLTWTVQGGLNGNGFAELVRAQKVINPDAGNELQRFSQYIDIRPSAEFIYPPLIVNGNVLSVDIGEYMDIEQYTDITSIGEEFSAQFALSYVPFSMTTLSDLFAVGEGPWAEFDGDSVFDLSGQKPPVWIIRNGVNDEVQNGATDFNLLGNGTANGNGAVAFTVQAGTPATGTLVIKNGAFEGPVSSDTPYITFTTEGYSGTADSYYAVVAGGDLAPAYSDYTESLGSLAAGDHRKQVSVPQANGNYDIYIRLLKGGQLSAPPEIINTAEGSPGMDWEWANKQYKKYYVSSTGDNANTGDKDHPLATVAKALEKVSAAYGSDASWPGKGTGTVAAAGIVVSGTVTATGTMNITGSSYPPLVFTDEGSGGTLQISNPGSMDILGGARVTLDGSLTLRGQGMFEPANVVVAVNNSSFTMNSGVITSSAGYMVQLMNNATFTMNSGLIQGNKSSEAAGGGVRLYSGSSFIMNYGVISDCRVGGGATGGGGVHVSGNGTTFTMNNGVIFNNIAQNARGGGVAVAYSGTFNMYGGEILGNSATTSTYSYGAAGGVYVSGTGSVFNMYGGEIAGNSSSFRGGGVCVQEGNFKMYGGDIVSNSTPDDGGGVYVMTGYFTMEQGEISFNSASYGGGVFTTEGDRVTRYVSGILVSNSASEEGDNYFADDGVMNEPIPDPAEED